MKQVAALLMTLGLAWPMSASEVCSPRPEQLLHLKKDTIVTTKPTALLVVHASREFHGKERTELGIRQTVEALQGRANIYYVHTGKYKNAMYPQCEPDAFFKSHSGNVNIELNAKTLVLVGGHYMQCLNDTWIGIAKSISNFPSPRNLRIVFVLDGVFDLLSGLHSGSGLITTTQYEQFLYNPKGGLSPNYAEFTEIADDETLIKIWSHYFKRRPIPRVYSIFGHWKGEEFLIEKGKGQYRIDVHYIFADELSAYVD